jgi:hypothetical protein
LLAIQQNPRVQTVVFDFLQLSGDSMASFLDTATSVTELQFVRCGVEASADALAIAAALQRNTNIQRLVLAWLDVELLITVLNSLASEHSKSKLQSLAINGYFGVVPARLESVRAAVLDILQPHSTLRSLKFYHSGGFETAQDFARLFTAVETSPLESFSIDTISSWESSRALIASIPKMQVGSLEVDFGYDLAIKRDLLGAVKRNASLRTIVARLGYARNLFENEDIKKLTSYSARNEFLAQWMENPTAMSKAAWPEYLEGAQTTGPDTVFRILRSLAPSLGLFEGEPCRKRRPPDSPS